MPRTNNVMQFGACLCAAYGYRASNAHEKGPRLPSLNTPLPLPAISMRMAAVSGPEARDADSPPHIAPTRGARTPARCSSACLDRSVAGRQPARGGCVSGRTAHRGPEQDHGHRTLSGVCSGPLPRVPLTLRTSAARDTSAGGPEAFHLRAASSTSGQQESKRSLWRACASLDGESS